MPATPHTTTLPQRRKVADCVETLWFLLFPDHHASERHSTAVEAMAYCRKELTSQIERALTGRSPAGKGVETADTFFTKLPEIKAKLMKDAQAAFERDPAAAGLDEIILSYPGFLALMTHRLAHELALRGVPFLPRMMSEYAHSITGCDIHPEATIGESFFIDHATGVVIGQTAIIGNRVTVYQGVTLGSLSVKGRKEGAKRHPTIEDDVVLYSNATILGGETVVGARSVIGGSSWITFPVPPDSRVILASPQTVTNKKPINYIPNWDI